MNKFDLKIGKIKAEFMVEFYDNNWSIKLLSSELNYNRLGGYVCSGIIDNNKIYCLELATEFTFFKSEFIYEIKTLKQNIMTKKDQDSIYLMQLTCLITYCKLCNELNSVPDLTIIQDIKDCEDIGRLTEKNYYFLMLSRKQ